MEKKEIKNNISDKYFAVFVHMVFPIHGFLNLFMHSETKLFISHGKRQMFIENRH